MAYTKGCWHLDDGETICASDGLPLATTSFPMRSTEECEGNARLIAAAPELLSALKRIGRMKVFQNGKVNRLTILTAIEIAAQAIAKAEAR
jgi:type VI protein secretion system component VasF